MASRKKNDALRAAFAKDGTRAFMLKRGGQTSQFAVVSELTAGWYAKFNTYRGQMVFKVATTSDAMDDLMSQTSYIAYGVPVEAETDVFKLDVYSIAPDRVDVVPPNGSSVYWKVFATKVANERFTIPA
jgi:hypothetical protein